MTLMLENWMLEKWMLENSPGGELDASLFSSALLAFSASRSVPSLRRCRAARGALPAHPAAHRNVMFQGDSRISSLPPYLTIQVGAGSDWALRR